LSGNQRQGGLPP